MAHAPKKDDSVFDFLYSDAQRIEVFLAQLNQFGHLTGLIRTRSEGTTASGGVNLHVAKVDSNESEQTTLQKQYDPRWIAPLNFLDQTQEIMSRDLAKCRIGELVLVSGNLAIFDMGLMEKAWKIPSIRQSIVAGLEPAAQAIAVSQNRHERRKSEKSSSSRSAPTERETGFDLVAAMPHATMATINTDDDKTAWCVLRQESLTTPASEMLLKHGVAVSGRWNIVGIIDALPETDELSALQQLTAAATLGGLASMVATHIAPAIKAILGRPPTAYGITPILVFREISG